MRRPSSSIKTLIVAIVAALAGFLFVASGLTADGTNLRTGGLEDLRSLVLDRTNKVGSLETKVDGLQTQVSDLSSTKIDPALSAQITNLEEATGLTPVTGSALQVTLNDAPRKNGTELPQGVGPDDLVVHQQDVQSVVNAFWRGGATAIQVMDQRIISTSAIRCVGNTLLLQGRVYSPPFKITAVGNIQDLQRALDSEPGVKIYKEYVDKLGLGWKVAIINKATLPEWQGSIGGN
jgi:uncharacterized protein YlxW (UPF0749 family)